MLCALEKMCVYLVYTEDLFRTSYIAINLLCHSESAKSGSLPPRPALVVAVIKPPGRWAGVYLSSIVHIHMQSGGSPGVDCNRAGLWAAQGLHLRYLGLQWRNST